MRCAWMRGGSGRAPRSMTPGDAEATPTGNGQVGERDRVHALR